MIDDMYEHNQEDAWSIMTSIGPSAIEALPNEILIQIIAQIGTVQAIKRVSVVCKRWDALIRNTVRLFEGVDLEYLAVDSLKRIETLQGLVKQGVGGKQSCVLKTAHVCYSLHCSRYSEHSPSTSTGSSSTWNDGDVKREYHDYPTGGRCSVYDASEEAMKIFRHAKGSQDLIAAWLEISQANERLVQPPFRQVSWSVDLEIQKEGIFAATTFPACSMDRRTFVSIIARAWRLNFNHIDRNFALSILSRKPASVTTLSIIETIDNTHRGPYAGFLTEGMTLELDSVENLHLDGTQLNSAYTEESGRRIIAPHLSHLELSHCQPDLVLLRSAANTLTTLHALDIHPISRGSTKSKSLLDLVLGMENLQKLTIKVDLTLFCKAFSAFDASGRFPCPRLTFLSLDEANQSPSLQTLLKHLADCFYARDRPEKLSTRTWWSPRTWFGRRGKDKLALDNDGASKEQWGAATRLHTLEVSSLVSCQESDYYYGSLNLLVALIANFDIFLGEGTTEQEQLAKEEFERWLDYFKEYYLYWDP